MCVCVCGGGGSFEKLIGETRRNGVGLTVIIFWVRFFSVFLSGVFVCMLSFFSEDFDFG